MHVGHAFGGMKAKMSFDPPFIVADPEIIKISATYNGKKTVGILIVSDGVNASKGARLSAKVIEKLVQSKVQKLNAKLQECGVKRNNMILETANDLATEIVNAATSAQEKLGVRQSYQEISSLVNVKLELCSYMSFLTNIPVHLFFP